jgi:hypothetical protein
MCVRPIPHQPHTLHPIKTTPALTLASTHSQLADSLEMLPEGYMHDTEWAVTEIVDRLQVNRARAREQGICLEDFLKPAVLPLAGVCGWVGGWVGGWVWVCWGGGWML